jgi:hypothetical protein
VGQNTNSDEKIGLDLSGYAADLVKQRDGFQALFDEFGDDTDRGRTHAYRDALAMLHRATDGQFGQTREDQLAAKAGR